MKFPGCIFLTLSIAASAWAESVDETLFLDPMAADVPHVLTAVRLRQPAAEVPASVTVLDADFIAATGATTITELMRFVPGMMVAPEIYDNNDSVQYHGGPAHFPKGMQILLDGHTIFGSALNSVNWYQLPVAVEQIQRIEVVRGPNAPTYGTNAYQAVINIITRHTADSQGGRIVAEGGNNRYRYGFAQAGWGYEGNYWAVSALHRATDNLEDLNSDIPPCNPCSDNRRANALSLRGDVELSHQTSLRTSLYVADARKQVPFYQQAVTENDITDRSVLAGLTLEHTATEHHQVRLTASYLHNERLNDTRIEGIGAGALDDDLRALFLINPEAAMLLAQGKLLAAYSALDLTDQQQTALAQALATRYADITDAMIPVSGDVRAYLTEDRVDVEIQDTWALSPDLTFVSGLGYRYEVADSEHFYGGRIDDHKFRAFAHVNWKPADAWVAHAGLMYEKEGQHEEALSFRSALNYLLTPLNSIRVVFNESARTPDFFEEHAYWTFQLKNIETEAELNGTTYFESYIGPGDLDQQRIRSYELGYYGRTQSGSFDTDLRAFREYQYDVIYRWPSTRSPVTYTDNEIWYTGIEGQASWYPRRGTQLRFNGAYTELTYELEEGLTEERIFALYAPVTTTTSWIQQWPGRIHTTATLILGYDYGSKDDNADPTDMKRLDLYVRRPFELSGLPGEGYVKAQRDFSSDPHLPGTLAYNSVLRWQAGFSLEF